MKTKSQASPSRASVSKGSLSNNASSQLKLKTSTAERWSTSRCVSVIIPAMNEANSLRRLIPRLRKWALVKEIIVVANGCTDDTARVSEQAGAKVIVYDEALGHDVGRAIGARIAQGAYLLFADADIAWTIDELQPFITALRNGADIALNRYPLPDSTYYHHPTAVAKRALNIILDRKDLRASSLTAVPNAMRKSAIRTIGADSLAVPPVALAKAAMSGLRIVAAHHVDVRLKNRWSRTNRPVRVKDVIIGDHLEAVSYVIEKRGLRGGYEDTRKRNALDSLQDVVSTNSDVTAIVPAYNEASTVHRVIRDLKHAAVPEVHVIDNGSDDGTYDVAVREGAVVSRFTEALGHDVGRAIGAYAAREAKCALFVDADFSIPADDLEKFVEAVQDKEIDIALNDLNTGLTRGRKRDTVSTVKWFLNIALHREDLGVCSLTAIPHAVSRIALQEIPHTDFAVPPKALVRASLAELHISAPHYVEVVKRNRYRSKLHSMKHGAPLARLIVGDHVEALALLLSVRGPRGGFPHSRALHLLSRRSHVAD